MNETPLGINSERTRTENKPTNNSSQLSLQSAAAYFGAQVGRRHRVAGARGAGRRFKTSGGRVARALRRLAPLSSRVSRIPARRTQRRYT